MLEAESLAGEELLDSTRARLFEGGAVSTFISPRRTGEGRSEVSITLLPKSGALDPLDSVVVTLDGEQGRYEARLDVRGRCVVRDVPDARYRLRFWRATDSRSDTGGP